MIRYVIALLVFFAGIVLTIVTAGVNVSPYVDIPGLILAGLVPFLFVSIVFGFKDMALAFSVALKKETAREQLIQSLNFFTVYGKTTWIAGFIAVLIGVVGILANLEDRMALGPNMALALIAMLYSGILYMVLILPFTVLIQKQLKE